MTRTGTGLVLALLVAAGASTAALMARNAGGLSVGQGPAPAETRPPVSVALGRAARKAMPVRLDAIGAVQTVASVTIRSRVDSQIMEARVSDGAVVKEGDVLFKLDSRQVEAQLKQAESSLARDRAALQAAVSDLKRQEELARRDFASEQKLETSRAQAAGLQATVQGDGAAIDSLRVQLSYYTLTAPIPGRIGAVGLKAGNIARSGDNALTLAVINQIVPIYVSFTVPQRYLPDIREAMRAGTAKVVATPQGYPGGSTGVIAFIDNAVDAATGTIAIRAVFDNKDELLWPGALCAVRLTLRMQADAIVVPREAVQSSQTGSFVYVADDGVARVRAVTIERVVDAEAVLTQGLDGTEEVVTDGQLLLTDGARVAPRHSGGEPPGPALSKRGSAT